jgi:hypothetical protein
MKDLFQVIIICKGGAYPPYRLRFIWGSKTGTRYERKVHHVRHRGTPSKSDLFYSIQHFLSLRKVIQCPVYLD